MQHAVNALCNIKVPAIVLQHTRSPCVNQKQEKTTESQGQYDVCAHRINTSNQFDDNRNKRVKLSYSYFYFY